MAGQYPERAPSANNNTQRMQPSPRSAAPVTDQGNNSDVLFDKPKGDIFLRYWALQCAVISAGRLVKYYSNGAGAVQAGCVPWQAYFWSNCQTALMINYHSGTDSSTITDGDLAGCPF